VSPFTRLLVTPLLALALALVSAPSSSADEPARRVGYLCEYGSGWQGYLPFVERLGELGYATEEAASGDRRARLDIVFRGCAVTEDHLRELARELVSVPVEVIVATGVAGMAQGAGAQRLALLKEAVPRGARVAVLVNPVAAAAPALLRETALAARALGLRLDLVELRASDGEGLGQAFDRAFSAIGATGANALVVLPDSLLHEHRGWILAYAWKARLPAIYREEDHAASETPPGLMSYGPSVVEQYVAIADYVDGVLRGGDPAALPVARPATFELVINLKAASRLGLSLPKSLLARAAKVID
jgi:ABC-type uncharacterized transport system substrate-binding protein